MKIKASVEECAQRRDGRWLITFRLDGRPCFATSDKPVEVGRDVEIKDGEVVG